MSRGPVIADLLGYTLTETEKQMLLHPALGGIILFARNIADKLQLKDLINVMREIRPELLICVDQEGGRVQRFKQGFSVLPALGKLGDWYDEHHDLTAACELSRKLGRLMAEEVRAVGVDLSFAPVLDVNWGNSEIIGNRAFHRSPEIISALGAAYIAGMHQANMPATGKHFPGHGAVRGDSHTELPIDSRYQSEIEQDILPFKNLILAGLDAIMPAHIIYPEIDDKPVGFSTIWLKQILRGVLGFTGIIFSDDLTMEGAASYGAYPKRAEAALAAGCDFILICNNQPAALSVLQVLVEEYPEYIEANKARRQSFSKERPEINIENSFIEKESLLEIFI